METCADRNQELQHQVSRGLQVERVDVCRKVSLSVNCYKLYDRDEKHSACIKSRICVGCSIWVCEGQEEFRSMICMHVYLCLCVGDAMVGKGKCWTRRHSEGTEIVLLKCSVQEGHHLFTTSKRPLWIPLMTNQAETSYRNALSIKESISRENPI